MNERVMNERGPSVCARRFLGHPSLFSFHSFTVTVRLSARTPPRSRRRDDDANEDGDPTSRSSPTVVRIREKGGVGQDGGIEKKNMAFVKKINKQKGKEKERKRKGERGRGKEIRKGQRIPLSASTNVFLYTLYILF